MKIRFLIATAAGAILFASSGLAQVQTQQQQNDFLGQLLGAVFGTNQQASEQTLEADWNQGRRPFEERRPQFEARIDGAVRDGSLSRNEADQMRREFNDIVRLEAQYAAGGSVSAQQQTDLRMRYRALMQRSTNQGYQQAGLEDDGEWQPLSNHSREFEQRVNEGLRNRQLTQTQARQLRTDWRNLAQLETNYRRNGINAREQTDLWTRYNAINDRLGSGFGDDRNTARWSQMESRLVSAERNGTVGRDDANQVRVQLGDLARLDAAYAQGGYSAEQRTYLSRRYTDLDSMLRQSVR